MNQNTLSAYAKEHIYQEAKLQWGIGSQVIAAAEELSEASAVLCRYRNDKTESEAEVITELADAEIMLEQLRLYFDPAAIDAEKDRKLRRLMGRLGMDGEK